MNVTPKTMARQITVARQERAERKRIARVAPRTRLAFTSETGVTRADREIAACEDLRKFGHHVMFEVDADLPGDRSVGHCWCGEYMDTGTWNERNA